MIEQKPGAAGLFEVGVRGEARTFTMYDFEVSIARMLNGRRSVSELIEAAGRIGIPVSLESFRKFARQLEIYGFLVIADVASPRLDEGPWVPRAEWKPEVRELFQSALRTFRKDRPVEARGYVEALLEIQPDVPEAIELLARIEERINAGGAAPQVPTFDLLHTGHATPRAEGEGDGAMGAAGEREAGSSGWDAAAPAAATQPDLASAARDAAAAPAVTGPDAPSAAWDAAAAAAASATLRDAAAEGGGTTTPSASQSWPEQPADALPGSIAGAGASTVEAVDASGPPPERGPAPEDSRHPISAALIGLDPGPPAGLPERGAFRGAAEALDPVERRAIRPARWPFAAAGGVLLLALVGLLIFPVKVSVSAAVQLAPLSAALELRAPLDGRIAKLAAQAGEWLEPGALVLVYDDAALKEEQVSLERELGTLARQIERETARGGSRAAKKALATLKKKQAELDRLTASRERLLVKAQTAKGKRTLAALDRKLTKKAAELEKAKRVAARTDTTDDLAALRESTVATTQRLAEVQAQLAALEVRAEGSGLFSTTLRPGDAVKEGDVVGQLLDNRTLRARIAVQEASGVELEAGQAVRIRLGERAEHLVNTRLTKVEGEPGALWSAEAVVENPDRRLPPHGTGVAQIDCGRQPLVKRLFRR